MDNVANFNAASFCVAPLTTLFCGIFDTFTDAAGRVVNVATDSTGVGNGSDHDQQAGLDGHLERWQELH